MPKCRFCDALCPYVDDYVKYYCSKDCHYLEKDKAYLAPETTVRPHLIKPSSVKEEEEENHQMTIYECYED